THADITRRMLKIDILPTQPQQFTVVDPGIWLSALAGERRVVGKPRVQFMNESRNSSVITSWGSNLRLRGHEWRPAPQADVHSFVGSVSCVPHTLVGSTSFLSTHLS